MDWEEVQSFGAAIVLRVIQEVVVMGEDIGGRRGRGWGGGGRRGW